jgi:hypothetical protein
VQAEEAGDRLTEDELFASVVLLLIAGHENLTGLLGCGTLALLQHPDQLQRLRAEPALLPNAVEELIRWVTPNQFIRRIALEDVTIGGTRVRRDQALLLVLAAANRDPPPASPIPTGSTSAAPSAGTSPSATASTTASASPWPAWRARSSSARCSRAARASGSPTTE